MGYNEDFVVRSAGRLGRRPKGKKCRLYIIRTAKPELSEWLAGKIKQIIDIVSVVSSIDIFYE
jgi:hypothetical protein